MELGRIDRLLRFLTQRARKICCFKDESKNSFGTIEYFAGSFPLCWQTSNSFLFEIIVTTLNGEEPECQRLRVRRRSFVVFPQDDCINRQTRGVSQAKA